MHFKDGENAHWLCRKIFLCQMSFAEVSIDLYNYIKSLINSVIITMTYVNLLRHLVQWNNILGICISCHISIYPCHIQGATCRGSPWNRRAQNRSVYDQRVEEYVVVKLTVFSIMLFFWSGWLP